MSILFLGTESPRANGTTQRMLFLARAIGQNGTKIAVALPEMAENRDFCRMHLEGVDCHFFPRTSVARELSEKHRLIRETGCQVAHSFCLGLRYVVSNRLARVRSVRVIYDWDELLSEHTRSSPATRLKHLLVEQLSLRLGHGYTVASEYLRRRFVGGGRVPPGQVLLLPNGFDEALDRGETGGAVAARIEADPASSKLVYVGAITRGYQIHELLELAAIIRAGRRDWKIFVIGAGADLPAFRKEVADRGLEPAIAFMGWTPVAEIAGCLKRADLLLFPFADTVQNRARCPLKIFQYLASGVPVVTNRVGEAARTFGEKAAYYRPGDAMDLFVQCDAALAAQHRSRWSEAELEEYSWRRRAADYLRWVERLAWLPAGGGTVR